VKERVRQWWDGLQQRERWILAGGVLVVAITLVWLILNPLFGGVSARSARVAEKEELVSWMQRSAATLPQGSQASAPAMVPVLVINRTIDTAGLGPYLKQTQPVGENGARTQFEAVPFDALMQWLSQLANEHGLRIESAQLDTAGRPGTTDARLSLERGGS
jgi:general secretion pathway protein M